jgi:hypothetical protein
MNPRCKQQGFSFGPFDIGPNLPTIVVGTFSGRVTGPILEVDGESVLSVAAPQSAGGPFLISAALCDRQGHEILTIESNEWKTPTTNWDVEIVGPRISIRRALGDISLVVRSDPPERLVVERLDMFHRGILMRCAESSPFEVTMPSEEILRATNLNVEQCAIGIQVANNALRLGIGGTTGFDGRTEFVRADGSRVSFQGFSIIQQPGSSGAAVHFEARLPATTWPTSPRKIGRNEICPCGSGKKYKKCHGS